MYLVIQIQFMEMLDVDYNSSNHICTEPSRRLEFKRRDQERADFAHGNAYQWEVTLGDSMADQCDRELSSTFNMARQTYYPKVHAQNERRGLPTHGLLPQP